MYRVNYIFFSFVAGEYEFIAASLSLLRPVSMVMCAAFVRIKAQFLYSGDRASRYNSNK